ncbi:histone-lysine N-methyltransferase SMYD3 isoform X1 [Sitodiplosis mosellana]|uniref:histone-lysine N-methyltransferase SMYD3 isoform X1 n=1 Tax=Sitodiplosis mosellana TaxID=263140 RepID=UPI0024452455|nr:histone-lysine N-methyltransferase SMYD3 isoform X1 [Sitodiplosis mosellana]
MELIFSFHIFRGKVLKCSGCQYVYYCGRECQTNAWKIHKAECPCLKRAADKIVPDAARVMARIILKLNDGGDAEKGYYTEKFYRKFKDLMSHSPDIQLDIERIEHVESLTAVLQDILTVDLMPNQTDFLAIYGRMIVNAFNILDQEMNSIATGIYLGVSITDHSCKPNAVATFQGTTLFIRTIEDLPSTNDWSKIFISYVDLMDPTEIRRHELQKNYYFLCKCERCLDEKEPVEMNAGACSNAKCNEFIDFESLKKYPTNCKKCDERITAKHYQQFKDVMHATRMHLDSMKMSSVAYLDICSILVKRQRGVLHRMNIWFLKTLDLAFESAIDFEKWNEALEYGIELLPGFRKYNGDFNPLLGLLHMKVGKIQLFTNNSKEALHNLNKASDIIKITHGEDHNLYRNELVPLLIQAACESEPNSDRNSDQK